METGPKMQSLTERQRAFVHAMLEYPSASATRWAELAGYRGGPDSWKVKGCLNKRDPAIWAACAEEVERRFKGAGALSIGALIKIVENPDHKFHFQAAVALADRAGYAPIARRQIEVEHRDRTGAAIMERIKQLAKKHGLDVEQLLAGKRPAELIEGKALPAPQKDRPA
jgi:hypothetical protein